MKDWKTTAVGLFLAACWYVTSQPGDFPIQLVHFANFSIGPGLAALGLISKDATRTLAGLLPGNTKNPEEGK